MVSMMPVDHAIVAPLGSDQSSRILSLALVHLPGESGARMGGAATTLLEEATQSYEIVMNKVGTALRPPAIARSIDREAAPGERESA